MKYAIVIHKDERGDYRVTVPDLPGCTCVGGTLDEALALAPVTIEKFLDPILRKGKGVPKARPAEALQRKPEYKDGTWAMISASSQLQRLPANHGNVTVADRLKEAVDRLAAATRDTPAGIVAKALEAYIAKHEEVVPQVPLPVLRKPGRR